MSVNETQDEIIEEFEGLTDWMDRYAYIIDLGNRANNLYPAQWRIRMK